jgi:cupin superfamily acireductone dioxygenase involved in methionine salvage
MAEQRRYELDELLIRPGTYFNPQTEVMVVVDDSPSMDAEIFNMEEFEGADWVLVSDDLPLDEPKRDELLETFQATHHGGDGRAVVSDDDADDLEFDEDEELEPDPDPDEA